MIGIAPLHATLLNCRIFFAIARLQIGKSRTILQTDLARPSLRREDSAQEALGISKHPSCPPIGAQIDPCLNGVLREEDRQSAQLDRVHPEMYDEDDVPFPGGYLNLRHNPISRCATITRSRTCSHKAPGPDLDTADDLPNRIHKGYPMTDIAAFPHADIHDLGSGVAHLRYLP